MNISVEIKRKDLVALNLYLFPRIRGNWIFFALLSGGIFAYILITKKPSNAYSITVAAFAALVGGVGGVIAAGLFGMVAVLLTVGKKSGVLGVHHYSLSEQGLEERTDANETLQKWVGIQSITKLPNYILFRINDYLFHIVPRRAFAANEEFNSFYGRAVALSGAA